MIWILEGFFRDYPDEILDAAQIDGVGTIGTLLRIVVPTSLPALGVATLFGFLVAWNEFIIALTLTRTPAGQTLPVGIASLITQFQTLWGQMMAVAVIYLLPVLAVTLITQRGIVAGLMSGRRADSLQADQKYRISDRPPNPGWCNRKGEAFSHAKAAPRYPPRLLHQVASLANARCFSSRKPPKLGLPATAGQVNSFACRLRRSPPCPHTRRAPVAGTPRIRSGRLT